MKFINTNAKISTRYGGKGVVAKIVPDNEMPMITEFDGEDFTKDNKTPIKKRVDLIHNNMGIINRGNPSALVELELNHISSVIRHRISKLDDVNKQKEYLLEYIKDADKVSYDNYVKLFDSLDNEETKEAIEDFIKNGIVLHQAPFFDNIESEQIRYLFNKYNIKKNRLDVSNRTFMVGDLYHLKLKHEPSGKLSAKSIDFNNYSGIPTRTPDSKFYRSRINNNPLRVK
ncbi:non-viral RNA polymerase beta subunit [Staphylococcus phage vB_StaM_PB50]|nr:non-viral RNA polymerase beta subunit [Staphylococcus phage vB_StaM_PB50]